MDLLQKDSIRRAESLKLFERDGMIFFGKWRDWWNAPKEQADKLLAEFRKEGRK